MINQRGVNVLFCAPGGYWTPDGETWYTALDTLVSDQDRFQASLAKAKTEFYEWTKKKEV